MRLASLMTALLFLLLAPLIALAQDCSGARNAPPGPALHRALYKTQELIDGGKLEAAARDLAKYAKDYPDEEHYLLPFTRGVVAYQLKKPEAAARFFTDATKKNPCFTPAWRNLAVVLFEQNKPAQAAEFMLRAYSLSKPPDPNLQYEAAALYLAAKQPARALPLLKDLAKRANPKKDWLKALVQAFLITKQPAQAEQVLKRLLAKQPGDSALWSLLAVIGQERNDPAAAAAALSVAYRLSAPKASGWRRLADLHLAAGAPARAAVFYKRAFAPDPKAKDLDLLARVYIEARDFQTALQTALAAVKAAPTAKRWARVGEIYLQSRSYAPALAAFRRAAKLKGGQGRYALLAGQCAMQLERYPEALHSLRLAMAEAKKGSSTAKAAAKSLQELERFLKSRQEGAG
jgi:predicted Zn-dependent protease